MEAAGIPTLTLVRTDFIGVMKNALSGLGLAPEAAMIAFSIDLFLPDSDISPLRERKKEIYEGLTLWKPRLSQATASESPLLRIEAENFETALVRANHLFITNLWGDGLPLLPATEERVNWILEGSAFPRKHPLGIFPPRGAVVSVESCAIALAMAGGRPEYLPLLISAVDTFLDPRAGAAALQAASGSAFPVIVVNGPLGKQIRLSSSFGCLGPDPQRPAGASIGRALHLMQQNLGGALPGVGSMANYGAMRYTNIVIAEDDQDLPPGWLPHGQDRHGYPAGSNSLSLMFANGAVNIRRRGAKKETAEEDALQGLYRMADFMRTPNVAALVGYEKGTPGILLIPKVVAHFMARLGWSKSSLREFFWDHSRIPAEWLKRSGADSWIEVDASPVVLETKKLDPWPITLKPENFAIVCAGGDHPTNSFWLQGYCPEVIGREILLPDHFEDLLRAADRDLGCGTEACQI
ncbi:MAG: hypothetical protein AB1585_13425 [Thermodesulfobacteriota bacterium]